MFRRKVQPLEAVLSKTLRANGIESPLLQYRLVDMWDSVAERVCQYPVGNYTGEKYIKNQTLFVKILNPALRGDMSMCRSELVRQLNAAVGSQVITDIKLY